MVDFQSRDTRRGDDESDDSDPEQTDQSHDEGGHDHGDEGGHEDHDDGGHEPDHEDHDHEDHDHGDHDHHHAHDVDNLGVAVVTVSSSRSLSDDPAGDTIVAGMEDEGHEVVSRDLIADSYDGVQGSLDALVGRDDVNVVITTGGTGVTPDDVNVVITTGGTGVTPDDVTIEAAKSMFHKELPGFGELFRLLSHDEIGTKVVGTRATAGVIDGVVVFCLPGSENAVRLGVEEIIVKEAGHLAGLASRGE